MKRRISRAPKPTYTMLDEMMASPKEPTLPATRRHQLTRMWEGLHTIELAASPTTDDWRVCSDAVNLMETLIGMGEVDDSSGLLIDAITALALAGRRHMSGAEIRLDAAGIHAVRAILEDYAAVLEQLPARTMVSCHRKTERRLREILAGKKLPHDVEVINL